MTVVSIRNLSSGLRSFQNTQMQTKTFKPGETRTMDMAPSHVALFEREARKKNATVAITMSDEERELYDADMKEIGKANRAARVGAPVRIPGRPVPPKERAVVADKRFFVDPATVGTQKDSADLGDRQERDAEEEAEAVRKAVEAGSKKNKKTALADPPTEPAPEPVKKGKPKVERVALKKKGEE